MVVHAQSGFAWYPLDKRNEHAGIDSAHLNSSARVVFEFFDVLLRMKVCVGLVRESVLDICHADQLFHVVGWECQLPCSVRESLLLDEEVSTLLAKELKAHLRALYRDIQSRRV